MAKHEPERRRDVPRSCICGWWWERRLRRFFRMEPDTRCPWHYPEVHHP